MLTLTQALVSAKIKGFDYKSRSSRSEFWWVFLTINVISTLLYGIQLLVPFLSFIYAIFSICATVVIFFISIRRLHDSNKSGWWLLVLLIPFAGVIAYLVLMAWPGDKGPNKFGFDPIGAVANAANIFQK